MLTNSTLFDDCSVTVETARRNGGRWASNRLHPIYTFLQRSQQFKYQHTVSKLKKTTHSGPEEPSSQFSASCLHVAGSVSVLTKLETTIAQAEAPLSRASSGHSGIDVELCRKFFFFTQLHVTDASRMKLLIPRLHKNEGAAPDRLFMSR